MQEYVLNAIIDSKAIDTKQMQFVISNIDVVTVAYRLGMLDTFNVYLDQQS